MTKNDVARRTLVLLSVCFVLYIFRGILSLVLLTFILTYLIIRLVEIMYRWTKIPKKILTIGVYAIIVIFMYFAITVYVPKLFTQTIQMIEEVFSFYQRMNTDNQLFQWISANVSIVEIKQQLTTGAKVLFNTLSNIGSMGITFIMSFILSFFFIIEKEWVTNFGQAFFNSKIGCYSRDVAYLGKKFINTFGVVIEAQFIIAVVNTCLTTVSLYFMNFPNDQLLSLALMIFIFSLIPVAGVVISSVPLSLIAYTNGGIQDVIYVLIMIVLIHALESYLLNPKLMSSKTDLPVFFVFVILMFSEKFFGVWGLVIGIPAFVFLLDLLDVKSHKPKHVTLIEMVKEKRNSKN
ncbi:AI-2E family transporter [Vagococcus vulneris]|uniref:AI-2E family transporter n=2 Tax=Vagococcus vulneris TaxID=1977869 RepID=A0A429ZVD1_9ENTE|nr:AI-2E family transporter [Vagococcus vulneris]